MNRKFANKKVIYHLSASKQIIRFKDKNIL